MSNSLKQIQVPKWIVGTLCLWLGGTALFGGNIATMQKDGAGVYWIPNSGVITSYSIHYTKLYEYIQLPGNGKRK